MSFDALRLVAAKYRPAVEVAALLLALAAAVWSFGGKTAARAGVAEVSLEASAPKHAEQDQRIDSLEAHAHRDEQIARDLRAIRLKLMVPSDAGEDP